ncbi:MAG: hypothetical protein E6G29_10435 [Actinobacteria bacterium]|nr:MAG: hypothetical protein E6G29_10435 [Actinomycetota bacterium]
MFGGRLLLGVGAIGAAVVLSGCIVFKVEPVAVQNQTLGSVHVTIVACASRSSGSPSQPMGSCPRTGNSGADVRDGDVVQVLLAFRIPNGSTAPNTFSSSSTGPTNPGPQLNFAKSATYTSELQRLNPAPEGFRWVGYISQAFTYQPSGEQNFTASLDFGLPAGRGGHPFGGPFAWRPVVGARRLTDLTHASDPVNCTPISDLGSDATAPGTAPGASWICIDDPDPTAVDSFFLLRTRDAAILRGAKAKVRAGKTARLKFLFQYAGPASPAAFTFSANTDGIPDSTNISPRTYTPFGDSTKTVTVSFKVPKSTHKGTYTITLRARLPDGETRSGAGKLKVLKPKKH